MPSNYPSARLDFRFKIRHWLKGSFFQGQKCHFLHRYSSHFAKHTRFVSSGHPLFFLSFLFQIPPSPPPNTTYLDRNPVALKRTISRAPFHWTIASSINLLTLTFMVTHHNRNPLTLIPDMEVACYSAKTVTDKTNQCHIPQDNYLHTHHQWHSYVLWHMGRIITMAVPNRYYKL
jgi:hypothetical protein